MMDSVIWEAAVGVQTYTWRQPCAMKWGDDSLSNWVKYLPQTFSSVRCRLKCGLTCLESMEAATCESRFGFFWRRLAD